MRLPLLRIPAGPERTVPKVRKKPTPFHIKSRYSLAGRHSDVLENIRISYSFSCPPAHSIILENLRISGHGSQVRQQRFPYSHILKNNRMYRHLLGRQCTGWGGEGNASTG